MQFNLKAAGREGRLILYDPAAMPADLPVDADMRTQEPDPAPVAAIEGLARDGRALVIEMPRAWDSEARLRVFVDEPIPRRLDERRSRGRDVTGAMLRVPSGTLKADGVEFIELGGVQREHAATERAEVPTGRYGLEAFDLYRWKIAHRDAHMRENTSWAARAESSVMVVVAVLGVLLVGLNVAALPGLGILGSKLGWAPVLRLGLYLLTVDVVFFGAIYLRETLMRRFPGLDLNGMVVRAGEDFDRENPDLVAVLTRQHDDAAADANPGLLKIQEEG